MGAEPNWVARMGESLRRRSGASLKVLLPTAAALGAGAAIAVGSIPGSDGTVTACYNTVPGYQDDLEYGVVRIIDPTATSTDPNVYSCNTNEATITWNQQGPQGPAGPTGSQGTTGPQGLPGQDGANGSSGSLIGATTFSIDATNHARLFFKLGNVIGPVSGESLATKPASSYFALASFAAGTEKALTIGSGSSGAGAGKAEFQEFQLTKARDTDRAQLFRFLAGGTVIPTMKVVVASVSTGKTVLVATYTLKDVKITAIHDTAGPATSAEIVVGQFLAMSADYGSGKNTVAAGWNQVKNAPAGWNLTTPTQAARDTSHARR